jgi:outer membrane murein-binding lipoprotein Lpp
MKGKFFKGAIVLSTLASLTLAGCGQSASTKTTVSGQSKLTKNSNQLATPTNNVNKDQQQAQNVYLVVEPGGKTRA